MMYRAVIFDPCCMRGLNGCLNGCLSSELVSLFFSQTMESVLQGRLQPC